ncbi:molecule interacting with CasL isoform X2 [Dermatophagoides pteronyssinus]|uniref:molecule interacting with CasL isoform X2 n=1 Tax=Dermatophagoides pteronyssinus TaxID=6956 RepID=UPI003F6667E3
MATEATKTPTITTTNHHGHGHHHHHHNHHHVQSQQQQPQYSRNVIENVIKSLDQLILANNVKQILEYNRRISKLLHFNNDLVDDNNLDESSAINSNNNNNGLQNFFRLKNALNVKTVSKWNRVASILKTLDMKANQKEYLKFRSNVQGRKILIIGGGISGLRVSIELLLLGAKVICVEKRDEFTRNNVIHLWPNVINDMCTFESKRFYGKFCVGSIDHISIRQLQLILLKIAIIYGLNFYTNITFTEICPRIIEPRIGRCSSQSIQCDCCCHQHGFGRGSYAHFQLTSMQDSGSGAGQSQTLVNYLNRQSFDVIIGCDGRRHTFSRYFRRNNRRGKLAIGLTANFINHRTEEEVQSEEISGTSRIYQQQWFQNLQDETGIELENLVYYRDNTHYFVMTATKSSLLLRGVLKTDYSDSHQLLSMNNIDTQKLMHYSKDAAEWSSKLRRLEFARNSNNMPDVALFDFTSMYSATNASCAKKIHLRCCCDQSVNINSTENSRYMLLLLCGDSLLEPFWPTGSGAGRGFLSAMDAAWTVAQWFSNVDNSYSIDSMLNVISKREYIYRLLAQTSPENITNKNFSIDPQSRYKTLNILTNDTLKEIKEQVRHLIIDKPDIDMKIYRISNEAKRARRATVGIDPNDILKAKNLHVDTSKLDEFVCQTNHNHHHHLIDYQRNNHHTVLQYSVPSSSSANNNNRQQHCDNRNDSRSPIDVVEFLPRNHSTTATTNNIQNNSTRRPLDVQPRNDRLFSNMAKKNHHARNHFFHQTSNIDQHQQPQHSLHSNDIISNNCLLLSSSPSSSISSNHSKLDWISSSKNDNNLNNTSHESQIIMKQGQQNHNESSGNDKENCPIPDFKQMFLLDDYDDDNGNDDDDYLQSKSKSSMVKNRLNSMSQKMFGNPHHNDSLHDFEKSLSRRPVKKSSDIMEKAQFLEQKFEEHNRSYQPNLNRVGRIEEDDWNVKIWNDTNLFAPKIDKSGRPFVGENSRNLLQSRITQLNNNFEYNRPMISKTFLSSTTTTANANVKNNDFVNMLSAEVCQKLNSGNNNNIVQQQQPSLPIETIIGKTSSGDTTDSQIKITSAFRDPSTNIRSRIPGSSDLLKPIGDCYRCLKTLLANDRVTILGRNFHRNCLTCKICNVSLRHDELMASIDDFICKICLKIRSRQIDDIDNDSNNIIMTTSTGSTFSNSSMINDSKNAFLSQAPLSSSLNLSLMEAKKNFLENAQQIDLRERAEFELIIDDDDNTNPSNQSDNNDNDVEQQQDDVEFDIENDENQQEEINDDVDDQKQNDEQEQLQQQQQSSDLSDSSDVHCSSSDNYTDDEHSSDSSSSSSCLPQRPSSIKSSTTVPLHKSSSSSSSSSSTSSNSANQKNVDHSYNIDFGSGFTKRTTEYRFYHQDKTTTATAAARNDENVRHQDNANNDS